MGKGRWVWTVVLGVSEVWSLELDSDSQSVSLMRSVGVLVLSHSLVLYVETG